MFFTSLPSPKKISPVFVLTNLDAECVEDVQSITLSIMHDLEEVLISSQLLQ